MVELCLKNTAAAADPGVLRANRNLSESLLEEQEANRFLTGSPNGKHIIIGHWCSDALVTGLLCREKRSGGQVETRTGEEGERQDLR